MSGFYVCSCWTLIFTFACRFFLVFKQFMIIMKKKLKSQFKQFSILNELMYIFITKVSLLIIYSNLILLIYRPFLKRNTVIQEIWRESRRASFSVKFLFLMTWWWRRFKSSKKIRLDWGLRFCGASSAERRAFF